MQNQPLVTVYIPTFNRIELLKRAVNSVQHQSYQKLEIIIVDDCSNDGTHEYLEKVSKEDHRIRYFLKEKNSGACVSRNIAIENARGEFITGLDDDDFFLVDRVRLFVDKAKKINMDENVLFSNIKLMIKENFFKIILKKLFSKNLILQKDLILNNYIGNQVFTKTDHLRKINGFDSNMKMWQDLECWYRLLEDKKAVRLYDSTYVLDVDHKYYRISDSKLNKLEATYDYFTKKHSLNNEQKKHLKTQFIHYSPHEVRIRDFISKIIESKNIWELMYLAKLLIVKFRKILLNED